MKVLVTRFEAHVLVLSGRTPHLHAPIRLRRHPRAATASRFSPQECSAATVPVRRFLGRVRACIISPRRSCVSEARHYRSGSDKNHGANGGEDPRALTLAPCDGRVRRR
jgi:hypothetical protein